MKKPISVLSAFLIFVCSSVMLQSCGTHSSVSSYSTSHSTVAKVDLAKANFKVTSYATGSAKCLYIFGIGGLKKKFLIEQARSEMFQNANMIGKPKVILNESVNIKTGIFPFVGTVKVIVSGYVYEFDQQ